MKEEDETVEDIELELRNGAPISGLLLPDGGGPALAVLPLLADRLKAAVMREHKAANDGQMAGKCGNAAAMRKALEALQRWFDDSMDGYDETEVDTILDQVASALAAPPRNCDRFADEVDAQLAFLNEEWLISVDKDSMPERDRFENWTDEMRSAYARWLMAKAEGGAE